jgi:hypothetical protein
MHIHSSAQVAADMAAAAAAAAAAALPAGDSMAALEAAAEQQQQQQQMDRGTRLSGFVSAGVIQQGQGDKDKAAAAAAEQQQQGGAAGALLGVVVGCGVACAGGPAREHAVGGSRAPGSGQSVILIHQRWVPAAACTVNCLSCLLCSQPRGD